MEDTKREKRKEIRRALAEIPQPRWDEASQELSSLLVDWLNMNPEVKKVAVFASLPAEVNLHLATILTPRIEWHYPIVSQSEMTFHRVTDQKSLKAGYAGILEPNPQVHPPVISETLDLVICPGLGFTKEGDRIGRGGGFYDRFLATVPRAKRLGVCLPEQLLSHIPTREHDIKMTHMLTTEGVKTVDSTDASYT